MTTLPDSAMVPAGTQRPRQRPTHRVTARQPYYFDREGGGEPAGYFAPGARVACIDRTAALCHVVDARGLAVYTPASGLEADAERPRRSPRGAK